MALVLFTDEADDPRGAQYSDVTGVSYEFPSDYSRMVRTGQPFVYHFRQQGYAGTGIVGEIAPSDKPGHFVAKVQDYREFGTRVPFRDPEGQYFEAKPEEGVYGVLWRQGVRKIATKRFEAILRAGAIGEPPIPTVVVGGYADPETAMQVERYSVDRALEWCTANFPGFEVVEMPHNNPGFDIRVGDPDEPLVYVEVKGTQSTEPVFWMTEGERTFSIANAVRYLLIVVSSISLTGESVFELRSHEGPVAGDLFQLDPSQWRGVLLVGPQ